MRSDHVKIELEEGDDYRPTCLKVTFNQMPWYFAFRTSRMDMRMYGDEKEMKKHEARDAIRSFIYQLEKELVKALPENLKQS